MISVEYQYSDTSIFGQDLIFGDIPYPYLDWIPYFRPSSMIPGVVCPHGEARFSFAQLLPDNSMAQHFKSVRLRGDVLPYRGNIKVAQSQQFVKLDHRWDAYWNLQTRPVRHFLMSYVARTQEEKPKEVREG